MNDSRRSPFLANDPATDWQEATVIRYDKTTQVELNDRTCLWYGVLKDTPVRVILLREPGKSGYELALVSTDHHATPAQLIERYARRWSIEVTFQDAKHVANVGDPRNRTRQAVERTVPFQLIAMTLTILWYAQHLHNPEALNDRKAESPWYTQKRTPSVRDMYTTARRVLITSELTETSDHRPHTNKYTRSHEHGNSPPHELEKSRYHT